MLTAEPLARTCSTAYEAVDPAVSVVVATHERAGMLPGLLAALEAQREAPAFEVVIVDDGSRDGTWSTLERLLAASTLPVLALRLAGTGGPSVPRNTAVAHARAPVVATTDDDCLPDPGWVALLAAAAGGGAAIVRGPVRPVDEPHGPWDRSIDVDGPTPWFETSNLAFPREPFLAAGGFPVLDLLPRRRAPRGFGEDVVLGRRLARALPTRWVSDAVVWHRWIPGTFTDCLAGQWRVVGFPLLVRELPELRDALWVKTFLTPRTAAFWSLLAGAGVATATGRRSALLAGLPWLAQAWPDARRRARLRAPLRLAQVAMADAVTVLALVEGSARARRVVL